MRFFLFILCIGGILFALTQLPVLTGGGIKEVKKALEQTQTIELSGKTLFISDVHLGVKPALEEQFNLDFSNVQNMVIVGDFFDTKEDFWSFGPPAGGEEESFRAVLGGIVPANFSGKIFYIHGTHDPQNLQTAKLSFENFEFLYIGQFGKFRVDGVPVVAYHGHQLHGGVIGGGISWLAKKIGLEVPLEKLGKKRFDIPADTWVVNGHSHVPGIDQASKVANTGSFVGAPFNKFIFRIHIGTGILFDGGKVELIEYEGLNFKQLYPFSI